MAYVNLSNLYGDVAAKIQYSEEAGFEARIEFTMPTGATTSDTYGTLELGLGTRLSEIKGYSLAGNITVDIGLRQSDFYYEHSPTWYDVDILGNDIAPVADAAWATVLAKPFDITTAAGRPYPCVITFTPAGTVTAGAKITLLIRGTFAAE